MVLANVSTYTGTTLISAGALQIGNGGATGSLGTNNITNNSSLIFNRTGAYSVVSPISGSGSLTQRGTGTLTLFGSNSYSGTTAVNGGTLVSGSFTALGSGAGALTVNNDSTLALGSYNATVGAVTLKSGSITGSGTLTGTSYTVSSGTIAPTLAGTGVTLTKTGAGSVTLNAAETFTGKTTVSAGTLILGSGASLASTEINLGTRASQGTLNASAAGGITIGNGQTLAGYGTVVGNTTIASGGSLKPGNSPGILGVTGNLTLNSGSTSIFEVAGSGAGVGFDQVNVTGALTYGGVLKLDITGSYNMVTAFQNYLFNFGSQTGAFSSVKYSLNGSGWSDLNYYAANNTWQMWDNSGLSVGADNGYIGINLNTGMLTVVPEPSIWALLVVGVSTLMILRRRRG
jgi:autotransporter-associated beta strand protein